MIATHRYSTYDRTYLTVIGVGSALVVVFCWCWMVDAWLISIAGGKSFLTIYIGTGTKRFELLTGWRGLPTYSAYPSAQDMREKDLRKSEKVSFGNQ